MPHAGDQEDSMEEPWLPAMRALFAEDMKRRFEIWPGTKPGRPDLSFAGEVLRDLLRAKGFPAIWKRVEDWDRRGQPCELADDIFTHLIVHEVRRLEPVKSDREHFFVAYQYEVAEREELAAKSVGQKLMKARECDCRSSEGNAPAADERGRGSGAGDVTISPGALVKELESSAAGCQWLFEQWADVRECLGEPDLWWIHRDSFRVIRLLGKRWRDALEGSLVAEVFLASHAMDRRGRNPFSALRGAASLDEVNDLLRRLGPRVKLSVDDNDEEEGRQTLLAIVEEAMAGLRARAKEHEERASGDEARIALWRAFDASPRGQDVERFTRDVKERVKRTIAIMRKYEGGR
jgi:hypothetical protein